MAVGTSSPTSGIQQDRSGQTGRVSVDRENSGGHSTGKASQEESEGLQPSSRRQNQKARVSQTRTYPYSQGHLGFITN